MNEDKYADEMLTDEELDKVAGGNCYETAADSAILKINRIMDEVYTSKELSLSSGKAKIEKVKAAWAKLGIEFVYKANDKNKYYFKGKSYKHEEALLLVDVQAEILGIGHYSKNN